MSFSQYLIKVSKIVLVCALLILGIRTFLVEPGRVNGRSMEPTLRDDQMFFVDKLSFFFMTPQRGEIVQFTDQESQEIMIKRIIALPHEVVSIRENKVYILGTDGTEFELNEDYLETGTLTKSAENGYAFYDTLDDYQYFVMGDNRAASSDSRFFGPIHRSQITGRVLGF